MPELDVPEVDVPELDVPEVVPEDVPEVVDVPDALLEPVPDVVPDDVPEVVPDALPEVDVPEDELEVNVPEFVAPEFWLELDVPVEVPEEVLLLVEPDVRLAPVLSPASVVNRFPINPASSDSKSRVTVDEVADFEGTETRSLSKVRLAVEVELT